MDLDIYQQIEKTIRNHERFLVTSHINPDGDAISSILTISYLLKKLGKTVQVIMADPVPAKFDYLYDVAAIKKTADIPSDFNQEVIIVVDAASLARIGNVDKLFNDDSIVLNVDHHASNELFGQINLIDPAFSSTVEIVYNIYKMFYKDIPTEIANMVYTGIICDTGRFLFPNTTSHALALSAAMVENGASPSEISGKIYHRNSQNTIHALAEALSTLEFYFEGKVAVINLGYEHLHPGTNVDTEGFVDYLLSIDGTEVQMFLVEKEPGAYKISIRSRRWVDVNEIARNFGGGGHKRAAGFMIKGDCAEIKTKIMEKLQGPICQV